MSLWMSGDTSLRQVDSMEGPQPSNWASRNAAVRADTAFTMKLTLTFLVVCKSINTLFAIWNS